MIKCLKKFNFGDSFISWVKILYNNIESCVINNGKASNFFKLERGVRQGCCLSALLFIVVAEILAINIRADSFVNGIEINNEVFKISQLADDTTLYLSDIESLKKMFLKLEKFSLCSGLKINKEKTEVFPLNINSEAEKVIDVVWKRDKLKSLGVWFTLDENDMSVLNLNEKLINLKRSAEFWSARNISIHGRVMILKTKLLSQIINICSLLYVPDTFICEVDKIFFEFLGGKGKRPKIKREVVVNNKADGGIRMIDFKNMVKALKISWVKRILSPNNLKWKPKWKMLTLCMSNMNDTSPFTYKMGPDTVPKNIPKFHQQMLKYWFEFFSVEPSSIPEILNEKLCFNKFILIQGQPIKENLT